MSARLALEQAAAADGDIEQEWATSADLEWASANFLLLLLLIHQECFKFFFLSLASAAAAAFVQVRRLFLRVKSLACTWQVVRAAHTPDRWKKVEAIKRGDQWMNHSSLWAITLKLAADCKRPTRRRTDERLDGRTTSVHTWAQTSAQKPIWSKCSLKPFTCFECHRWRFTPLMPVN